MSQGLTEVVRLVVHDLANLFTCILAASSGDRVRAADLAAIHDAARTGGELLGVLRTLGARLPGGCRVRDVAAPCAILLGHVGRPRSISVHADLDDVAVAIPGYEVQEVILNLGLNAIAALPDGGNVALTARAVDGHAVLAIRDDGPGMPEVAAPREPGHSGLGLIASRAIVDAAGGTFTIAAAPDRGTEITIVLPSRP